MPFAGMASRIARSRLGVAAIHRPAAGGEAALRVVPSTPDVMQQFGGAAMAPPDAVFVAPKADIPGVVAGDILVVEGLTYQVSAVLADARGVSWRMPCRRLEPGTRGSRYLSEASR